MITPVVDPVPIPVARCLTSQCTQTPSSSTFAYFQYEWRNPAYTGVVPELLGAPTITAISLEGAVATASSEGWGGAPARGIDGNPELTNWDENSCTHTNNGGGEWFKLEFPSAVDFSLVTIYPEDTRWNQFSSLSILVDGVECASGITFEDATPKVVQCQGTQVTELTLSATNHVILCELELQLETHTVMTGAARLTPAPHLTSYISYHEVRLCTT